MKAILKYLSVFLFTVIAADVSAQNMRAVNTMLNNQFMRQQMQMQMQMSMMRLNKGENNNAFTFKVTMADGSEKKVHSKMYSDTLKHKIYLLFVDKNFPKSDTNRNKRIYPEQTRVITRDLGYDATYRGIPKDTCWMFKIISGAIKAYSYLGDDDELYQGMVGLQLNNGPIERFSEENLKKMVEGDTEVIELVQKKEYLKAIKKYNKHAEKAAKK